MERRIGATQEERSGRAGLFVVELNNLGKSVTKREGAKVACTFLTFLLYDNTLKDYPTLRLEDWCWFMHWPPVPDEYSTLVLNSMGA